MSETNNRKFNIISGLLCYTAAALDFLYFVIVYGIKAVESFLSSGFQVLPFLAGQGAFLVEVIYIAFCITIGTRVTRSNSDYSKKLYMAGLLPLARILIFLDEITPNGYIDPYIIPEGTVILILLYIELLLLISICLFLAGYISQKRYNQFSNPLSAEETERITADRLRYTKNTASSRLCYFAILLDVFYFVNIYESDRGSWYYSLLVGSSIVLNLLFMLYVFLASEGVKNYKPRYSIGLYIVGALQIVRIFIIPVQALSAKISLNGVSTVVMPGYQGAWAISWLVGSAVCLMLAGIINQKKCAALGLHAKEA